MDPIEATGGAKCGGSALLILPAIGNGTVNTVDGSAFASAFAGSGGAELSGLATVIG